MARNTEQITILEKDKVYKIEHPDNRGEYIDLYNRNYIISSPINDVMVEDDYFNKRPLYHHINFQTHFTICLDGRIIINKEGDYSASGINPNCRILELMPSDFKDIKKAIDALQGKYKYNRKLNQLILNDSIREK